MEQQLQDIGVCILHVIREMLVLGAAGFVIGLLLRKIVKEGSDRLINNIEFFIVTGCKFSVAPMLRSSAQIAGNRLRRERCAKKKAWDSEPA